MGEPSQSIFAPVAVREASDADGTRYFENAVDLPKAADRLLDRLDHWADLTPERPFLCERDGDGWTRVTYADARARVDEIAGRLLALELSSERPLMTLSPNTISHALVMLAAMRIGVPVAVVQPAYAAGKGQNDKLASVVSQVTPGAIFVGAPVVAGEAALRVAGSAKVFGPDGDHGGDPQIVTLGSLDSASSHAVQAAAAQVGPDTIAKLLFTSGSTGKPKGVINTHRMLCSNMAALGEVWTFLHDTPPRMVDWLPWCHTFGGNCCFNLSLYYGGTFHIDDGKPAPALVGRTVENIRLGRPNIYFNVPVGFDALLPYLEKDEAFAQQFFGDLIFLFSASSALPAPTKARLQAAARSAKHMPPVIGAWGSTETAPFSTVVYFETPFADNLGVPLPGTTIKMTPAEGKYELRVRGPNVTPGYWRHPELTKLAFDEEGFFRIGDAGKLADQDDPAAGIRFDGRTAENFKLSSGTWVNAGALRLRAVEAARPFVADAVVTGHDRDHVGLLLFIDEQACRTKLAGEGASELSGHPPLVEHLQKVFAEFNLRHGEGGSTRVARFLILSEPPSAVHDEITDKGSLNQRAILNRRQEDVLRLYTAGHLVDSI